MSTSRGGDNMLTHSLLADVVNVTVLVKKKQTVVRASLGSLTSRTVEGLADLSYGEHITTTMVLLFYLFVLPVAGVIIVLLWRCYINACDKCERSLARKHSAVYNMVDMQDFRLRHECCKKNVAPILFSLPTDFNFKHNCGSKCKGPKVWQPDGFP